jgi:hypothetical protein
MPEPATPPSSLPRPAKSGTGCLVAVLALPVVIILGLLIGKALGGDADDPEEERITLDEGTLGGTEWRVDAVVDVQGDICAFLYEDGAQLTGSCDQTPQDATFGEQTVVFGQAGGRERVEVALSDGEVAEIDTVEAGDIEGRFYVTVVDGDVDAEGYAPP